MISICKYSSIVAPISAGELGERLMDQAFAILIIVNCY